MMCSLLSQLWSDEQGQDIAEYAVTLAVILVLVVGTIRLIGSNANNVFSEAASSIHFRRSRLGRLAKKLGYNGVPRPGLWATLSGFEAHHERPTRRAKLN
jgi:Flp pilus assembly pilin Flp